MIIKRALTLGFLISLLISTALAQKPELTITLNEAFFDVLFDSVFKNFDPPEVPIARNSIRHEITETLRTLPDLKATSTEVSKSSLDIPHVHSFSLTSMPSRLRLEHPVCKESIQLLRENNGMRSAVRFREGKIYAPLAFTGNYSPPFIGCVAFAGYAETNIDLEFDQNSQRLIARAKVFNVALNGTSGVGGSIIARLVQSSIDKKINPIEIIRMDKLSFLIPIQNGANLRMKATGVRHEIENGLLKIHIAYEFLKK